MTCEQCGTKLQSFGSGKIVKPTTEQTLTHRLGISVPCQACKHVNKLAYEWGKELPKDE